MSSTPVPDNTTLPLRTPSTAETLTVEKNRRIAQKRKASQSWDRDLAHLSAPELDAKRQHISTAITEVKGGISRNPRMGHDYWTQYIKLAELHQLRTQVQSQRELEHFTPSSPNATWYDENDAIKLRNEYHSWKQFQTILSKHTKKLQGRLSSGREAFVRLFATSNCGLDISGSVGKRDSSVQKNFGAKMAAVYCPNPESEGDRWDPVLATWASSDSINAAHLYPWRQHLFMNEIFGPDSINDLFEPCNGLFLHKKIKRALDLGQVAIVPDLDLDPSDPDRPLDDLKERQDRVKIWEQQKVRDYKFIVLDLANPAMHKNVFTKKLFEVLTIAELHGRKLQFLTDARPKARYVWWTYLNTILKTSWQNDKVVQERELIGFVEEIGHDMESILGDGDETQQEEPRLELVTGLVEDAVSKSMEDEDGDEEEDGDPESENEYL
ncbi:hypothetical protein F53441_7370 [Fusarium austroafricanum]|uniref:HNH nuclease domain-containing protein n=1 Tax=Fusarium austroafricanum TaxID=2364996 RepID=A0A8H4KFY9_9HYPO|nr:hypothetical protein F53441_7370 [Fusarium austroafricanum]